MGAFGNTRSREKERTRRDEHRRVGMRHHHFRTRKPFDRLCECSGCFSLDLSGCEITLPRRSFHTKRIVVGVRVSQQLRDLHVCLPFLPCKEIFCVEALNGRWEVRVVCLSQATSAPDTDTNRRQVTRPHSTESTASVRLSRMCAVSGIPMVLTARWDIWRKHVS